MNFSLDSPFIEQLIRADREQRGSQRELGWFRGCVRGGSIRAFGCSRLVEVSVL